MSRLEGFEVMDVSTALPNDPKVKRLAREHPEQLGPGFLVYVSTMAESWKAGERVSFDDAWPGYLTFDQATVDALQAVKLLDAKGRVTLSAWRAFFEQARDRREKSRERWRRANDKRGADHAMSNGAHSADATPLPRGSRAVHTPPSDSSVPSESDSARALHRESHPSREADVVDDSWLAGGRADSRKQRPEKLGNILPRAVGGRR